MGGSKGILAAKQPLVVPMLLRLSHFKLNSYVVLVVSRQKGITLVFKTDPLQNVDINSTFDSIAVIQKFIQREIEGQLRQMFREDLPGIIHRLSQQWVKAKVEAPYLTRPPPVPRQKSLETASTPDLTLYRPMRIPSVGLQPNLMRKQFYSLHAAGRTSSVLSVSSAGRKPTSSISSSPTPSATTPAVDDSTTSFPDIENFDPTYGLRPEGLPAKSVFSGFRSLFSPPKGLADLTEESSEMDDPIDEVGSFDTGNWDDVISDYIPPPSVASEGDADAITEYESVPAVGGGTITRPRIYHSQSQITPQIDGLRTGLTPGALRRPALSARSSTMTGAPVQRHLPKSFPTPASSRPGSLYNSYFASATPPYCELHTDVASESRWPNNTTGASHSTSATPPVPPLYHSPLQRPGSSSSLQTQPSRSSDMSRSVSTPPPAAEEERGVQINRIRRPSLTSSNLDKFQSGSPPDQHYMPEHDPKIILRPALNNSISQLSTLSHSNHTLSPYTRTLEHFTVRSIPPRETTTLGPVSSSERQPVKARRKRTHRLGSKPAKPPDNLHDDTPSSPGPSFSEFDVSEMDRYFRSHDDLIPRFPDVLPSSSHARLRFPYQPSF